MGLIHTPRILYNVIKGTLASRRNGGNSMIGLGVSNPHIYKARVNLFDVDYLGHLNNAAYLSHAELARWQMTAENGLLHGFVKNAGAYVVTGTSIRFRREVRPIFRSFEVHSKFIAISDRHVWSAHDFRHADRGDYKLRAQVIAKAALLKRGRVVDPRVMLVEDCGMDPNVVDSLLLLLSNSDHQDNDATLLAEEIAALDNLEAKQRALAEIDDARINESLK